jgi:hypothetical protein
MKLVTWGNHSEKMPQITLGTSTCNVGRGASPHKRSKRAQSMTNREKRPGENEVLAMKGEYIRTKAGSV